jgi:hypothetical protein
MAAKKRRQTRRHPPHRNPTGSESYEKPAELKEISVCKKFLLTAADGKNSNTQFYNLDAIISVGYRVNSAKATQDSIHLKVYRKVPTGNYKKVFIFAPCIGFGYVFC